MKRLHGPFDPVHRSKREDVRERRRDGIQMGTCSCRICERRRSAGLDPHPVPDPELWVRLPTRDGQPATDRKVFLCDPAGVTDLTPTTGGT